ncbi:SLC13 family permease [Marinicella sp. W31]|uniref:SLC13 family permease n=1 Tax=Marinicella sp. W31 TaxID=3023713 RepID=UPI003757D457
MTFIKPLTFSLLLFLGFICYSSGMLNLLQSITLTITLATAVLWVTEWLPIPVASLLPLALFPLAGVLSPDQVAVAYGNPLIILLLGGFLLSMAMSHTQTHRFLANRMIHAVGSDSPQRILLSFMLSAFLLSMWISNTATTLMLLPIALAIIEQNNSRRFAIVLLLGIAYSASIGGTATPIGTPPNLIMIDNYMKVTGVELGFTQWMAKVLPVVILFFPAMYLLLRSQLPKTAQPVEIEHHPMTVAQKRTLLVFAVTAVLWITRTAPFGGWKQWFNLPYANDASVALLAVVALFVISDGRQQKLLSWKTANKIPWGILLLFAGGITIASAFKETGLSSLAAEQLTFLAGLPIWVIILTICLGITFLTEITSNTATTAIMMPILAATAEAINVEPLQLMLPAAISASCAFMLPVATAPNAIVYGSEQVPIRSMMRQGFKLNLIGAVLITAISSLLL